MSVWQTTCCSLLAVLVIAYDLYARRVPNRLLLITLLVAAAFYAAPTVTDDPSVGQGLLGFIAGLGLLLPFYLLHWMGAGDVKFMGVLGFLLGPKAVIFIWLTSCITLVVHTVCLGFCRLAIKHFALPHHPVTLVINDLSNRADSRMTSARKGRVGMPYAAHLALAALIYLFLGGVDAIT